MALTWNFANTRFFQESMNEEHSAFFDDLFSLFLVLGMKDITETNFDEWMYRLAFYEDMGGFTHEFGVYSLQLLEACVGARTNAPQLTRHQFHQRMTKVISERSKRLVEKRRESMKEEEAHA